MSAATRLPNELSAESPVRLSNGVTSTRPALRPVNTGPIANARPIITTAVQAMVTQRRWRPGALTAGLDAAPLPSASAKAWAVGNRRPGSFSSARATACSNAGDTEVVERAKRWQRLGRVLRQNLL